MLVAPARVFGHLSVDLLVALIDLEVRGAGRVVAQALKGGRGAAGEGREEEGGRVEDGSFLRSAVTTFVGKTGALRALKIASIFTHIHWVTLRVSM